MLLYFVCSLFLCLSCCSGNRDATDKYFSLNPSTCSISSGLEDPFQEIYDKSTWIIDKSFQKDHMNSSSPKYYYTYGNASSLKRPSQSGHGSDIGEATVNSIIFLAEVIENYKIESVFDVPCGDANWQFESWEMDSIPVYVGADITKSVVKLNKKRFAHHKNKHFFQWDLSTCPIPKYTSHISKYSNEEKTFDLVHVRDLLQHLTLENGSKIAQNLKESGVKYIVATTYPTASKNKLVTNGDFYMNNLNLPPFDFPKPIKCVETHPTIEDDMTCLYVM